MKSCSSELISPHLSHRQSLQPVYSTRYLAVNVLLALASVL